MVAYRFRGYDYHVTLSVGDENRKGEAMTIEMEDGATADQWRATFSADYIQDLTQKTGNYKQFDIFVSMVESALTKTSDSVTLDLLTYADLQLLRNQKSNVTQASSESMNSKRYLILTYSVEFDRIHYPLPLPYLGKPDPVALLRTIRELRAENEDLRKRISNEDSVVNESAMRDEYEKQLEQALAQNCDLEKTNNELTHELAVFREGRGSKEIRMLKGVVQSMEEDSLKEKNRHQRSAAKSQQELRRLKDEVERLGNAESDLKIRVRNLTTELADFKRPGTNFRSRASPSPSRNSAESRPSRPLSRSSANIARPLSQSSANIARPLSRNLSQPRSSSHGRTPVKSSSSTTTTSFLPSHRSAARDRSSSASRRTIASVVGDRLDSRRRTTSGDRSSERGVSGTRLSGGGGGSNSRSRIDNAHNKSASSVIRYRSPSPSSKVTQSASSSKRFDPTDYVKQKKEKEKEREKRISVEKKYKLGSGIFRGRRSAGRRSNSGGGAEEAAPPPRGLMSASPEARSWKRRTSSGESVGTVSRSSSVESLRSQSSQRTSNKSKMNPLRLSNDKSSGPSKSIGVAAKTRTSGGPTLTSSYTCKENIAAADTSVSAADDALQDTLNDASRPVDPDNEMAEIDARLNALQNFMKSMGHE